MKPKTVIQMKVEAKGQSHSRTNLAVRNLRFAIDEPEERGGTNAGPTPTEGAVSSLIGCTNVIGNKCAAKLGVDIGHLEINAVCDFDRRGVTLAEEIEVPFQKLTLTVIADGPCSDEDLQRVAAETAKFCPLSKLFRGAGTEITEIWRKS